MLWASATTRRRARYVAATDALGRLPPYGPAVCEADERPSLAVGGGSPADPDPEGGTRGRTQDPGRPPGEAAAAAGESGLDPSASAPDLVGAVVDFVELFVEHDGSPDDDTG
jgi:hypothetical protein